jgi:ribose transport system substrate-binding protein
VTYETLWKLMAATALIVSAMPAQADEADAVSSAAEHSPMACDRQVPVQDLTGSPKAKKPYKIEISVSTIANPYIDGLIYGASLAAADSGVTFTVDSGTGAMDSASQIRQIENAMTRRPDALLINPADPNGLVTTVDDLIEDGTPVVDVGTLTNSKKSFKVVQDDYEVGVTAGKTLMKLLPNGGQGIVQGGPENATWARRQVAGFLDTVKAAPNVKVNALTNEDLVPSLGLQKFTDAAQAHPKVDWINVTNYFALSPYSIPPEYKNAVYMTGSYDAVVQKAIKEGVAKAALPYFPAMVGYFGIATAVQKLNGDDTPRVTCIPNASITAETVDDPKWQKTNFAPEGWKPPAH